MTLPSMIGVCGRKHSGKSTLGTYLSEVRGYKQFAFADKVKEAVVAFDPLLFEAQGVEMRPSTLMLPGESAVEFCDRLKNEVPELRRCMQAMGNEVGQGIFGPFFWVDMVLRQTPQYERVVITDLRYPHECDRVRELGGYVIRVTRPSLPIDDKHDSERLVDECKVDADVVNDSTLECFIETSVEALHV